VVAVAVSFVNVYRIFKVNTVNIRWIHVQIDPVSMVDNVLHQESVLYVIVHGQVILVHDVKH